MRIVGVGSRPVVDLAIVNGFPTSDKAYWPLPADPIARLFTEIAYEIPSCFVDSAIGDNHPPENRPEIDYRLPIEVRDKSGFYDDTYYGSFVDNLRVFGNVFGLNSLSHPSLPKKETPISHCTLNGSYRFQGEGNTWYYPEYPGVSSKDQGQLAHFIEFRKRWSYTNTTGVDDVWIRKDSSNPNQYSTRTNLALGRPRARMSDRLADLLYWSNGGQDWGGIAYPVFALFAYTMVENLEISSVGLDTKISYNLRWNTSNLVGSVQFAPRYGWYYRNELTLSFIPGGSDPNVFLSQGQYYQVNSIGTLVTKLRSECLEHYGSQAPSTDPAASQAGEIWEGLNESTTTTVVSYVTPPQPGFLPSVNVALKRYSPLVDFQSRVHALQRDIRTSSFFSASDALSDLEESVNTNMIETISQLSQFFEVLPDLKGLAAIFADIKGAPIKSLGEMLKWMSGERLRFAFGTTPNYQLIKDVIPAIGRSINYFQTIGRGPVTAYGQFTYNFPQGEFGRDSSSLVARSKVVLNTFPSGVLRSILELSSLGILPSPSNGWALIPLSFVVDWGLNVAGRLKSLEDLTFLAGLDLNYMVHSYSILSPVLPDELNALGVKPLSPVPPLLKMYIRDFSRNIPIPRDSRWDFLMPNRLPNWSIAGSLIVQRSI